MSVGLAAEGFVRHRGLALVAAGGAVTEGGLLALFAPGAQSVAPQVTAIPSLAAYHDLRWLFADTQSWPWFAVVVAAVLVARAALDVLLLRLAWPSGIPPPPPGRAFVSCAALTLVAWLLLTPVATLAFGVAVLPFSWPFLAAFPIMLGMVAALSHGGAMRSWWRRLPPLRAWYGLACLTARVQPRTLASVPARVVLGLPYAPLAALAVFALVIYAARLLFTGAIEVPVTRAPAAVSSGSVSSSAVSLAQAGPGGATASLKGAAAAPSSTSPAGAASVSGSSVSGSALLVVGGFGSSCCDAANQLRAMLTPMPVRQFSYAGMDARGKGLPSGPAATNVSLPVLGDRIAGQVESLHAASGRPVALVAESEGTLGVYAMLARHPGLPVSAIVLLSPIVSPDQLGGSASADDAVSGDALSELDHLVGSISPYGPAGAQALLSSVSQVGASYFDDVVADASSGGGSIRWLTVIPLADAVTLPDCPLPASVIVVSAFHGGLLGDAAVLPMVSRFLSGQPVSQSDPGMRQAAEMITGASAAWRLPDTRSSCR
jgi:hypothetical protein